MYRIEFDGSEVAAMLTRLPDDLRDKGLAMAINKTAAKARTEMKRQIAAIYNLSSGEVGDALHVTLASWKWNKMTAYLYPTGIGGRSGRSMNVARFINGTSRGELTFIFKKNGATKLIDALPSGESKPFLGNSGRTVFRRQGIGRLPLEPVQFIGVQQMFNSRAINDSVLQKAADDLLIETERAVALLLDGLK